MKKLILIITFSLVLGKLFCQDLIYTEVVEVSGKTSKELYNCAQTWFAETYNDGKSVIQVDKFEDEKGTIIGKALLKYDQGFLSASGTTRGVINYLIKIETKEGKYKYEIYQFYHEANRTVGNASENSFGKITTNLEYEGEIRAFYNQGWYNRVWNDIKSQISEYIEPLISELKEKMKSDACKEKSDW